MALPTRGQQHPQRRISGRTSALRLEHRACWRDARQRQLRVRLRQASSGSPIRMGLSVCAPTPAIILQNTVKNSHTAMEARGRGADWRRHRKRPTPAPPDPTIKYRGDQAINQPPRPPLPPAAPPPPHSKARSPKKSSQIPRCTQAPRAKRRRGIFPINRRRRRRWDCARMRRHGCVR